MSWLPRVAEQTRERISREFDTLGPAGCLAQIRRDLSANNPELLDMATKCARDVGNPAEIMVGFGMFYRLLVAQSSAVLAPPAQGAEARQLDPLPRVTPQTRDRIVRQIDQHGSETFTRQSLEELERSNPELWQMAHNFSSRHKDYLGTLQGFALLYACLVAQAAADRASFH